MGDKAAIIPILLAKDIRQTIDFYKKLGFEIDDANAKVGYLITIFDEIEVHFQIDKNLDESKNSSMCYVRTPKAQNLFDIWKDLELPKAGIPRLEPISLKPWGMSEFAIIDPSGNLIRIGYKI